MPAFLNDENDNPNKSVGLVSHSYAWGNREMGFRTAIKQSEKPYF
jgi:hypothetical protein